ncbi:sulfurtransferase [Lysobacter sp. Root494]|uniref:sulfurtransferase n=1 Tax=Lysobacter sp. Root494 TaxID=1736549 RepID=UPI0006F3D701|nr:sulfurtransferase [Lysobacter sp. Root494]KQY52019.1 sulfurtransferase [Lysobacter sp. Root494]
MGWTTLVPPETLAVALQRPDLVIVDCRFSSSSPGAGEFAYEHSHLPGAVYAHLERDLSDMSRRGQGDGRHPWPDAETFTAKLGQWGILPHHQIVAYDDADGSMAARFWFLMRALGHEKVAVLDGGLTRWQGMRLPTNSDTVRRRATTYSGTFDASRLLDANQVQERLAAGDLLADARPADRFRGENDLMDRVHGHVPGAVNRPYAENMQDGRFKSPGQLAAEFRALLDGRSPEQAIMMCGSGVTACHNLLAMERAGLSGAKLYTGSWSGWIEDPSRPIAQG